MTTLKITVDTRQHASFLTEMLNGLHFIKNIEPEPSEKSLAVSQYNKFKKIVEKYASKNLFKEIKDPVKWQKKMRDEWE